LDAQVGSGVLQANAYINQEWKRCLVIGSETYQELWMTTINTMNLFDGAGASIIKLHDEAGLLYESALLTLWTIIICSWKIIQPRFRPNCCAI
jgi:3-oxoacyl-[acyl-carrier-protein] synthase III